MTPIFLFDTKRKIGSNHINKSMALSKRNAVLAGLVGLMVGLIMQPFIFLVIFYLESDKLSHELNIVLNIGIFWGLIAALWYGGLDVIKHYTLRTILIMQGHTPRKYADFLDDAATLIFLQKVGGGYRFIHRLLRDHFAAKYCQEGQSGAREG